MVCNRFRRKRKKRPIHRRVHGVGKKKKKSGGKGFDGGGIRQEWKTDVAESSRYNYIRNVVASIIVIASFCCMQRWATLRRYAIKGIGFPSEEELDLVIGCARGMGEDTCSNSDRVGGVLDLVLFRVQVVE